MKIHGGPYQMAGIPDLLAVYQGLSIWIEVKAPKKKPTNLQLKRMRDLKKAHAFVDWFDDADLAAEWIDKVVQVIDKYGISIADR